MFANVLFRHTHIFSFRTLTLTVHAYITLISAEFLYPSGRLVQKITFPGPKFDPNSKVDKQNKGC